MNIINRASITMLKRDLSILHADYVSARKALSFANKTPILASMSGSANKGQLMARCKKAKKQLSACCHNLSVFMVYVQQQEGRKPSQALMAIISKRLKPVSIKVMEV